MADDAKLPDGYDPRSQIDKEWDERPLKVGRAERILSASDDMRNLLMMFKVQLPLLIGPGNFDRALQYLDCIDFNAYDLQGKVQGPPDPKFTANGRPYRPVYKKAEIGVSRKRDDE